MSDTPKEVDKLTSMADSLFKERRAQIHDFNFGAETAAVFDDMLDRSVPFYGEIQRMIGELAGDFAVEGSSIYDLGCSTANTFLSIGFHLSPDLGVKFVGLDSSDDMLRKAEEKLANARFPWPYALNRPGSERGSADRERVGRLDGAHPAVRAAAEPRGPANQLVPGMNHNGCLILVEKVLGEHSTFNRLFIDHYYAMKKRKGYSEIEISQKREALENVLVPYQLDENLRFLRRCGFNHVDVFFKWYNFCGIVAIK